MKTIYKMLVAGILATAPLAPSMASSLPQSMEIQITLSDAVVHQILESVLVELQAQSTQELTAPLLFNAYKAGQLTITELGSSGSSHFFQVNYDGSVGTASLEDL